MEFEIQWVYLARWVKQKSLFQRSYLMLNASWSVIKLDLNEKFRSMFSKIQTEIYHFEKQDDQQGYVIKKIYPRRPKEP